MQQRALSGARFAYDGEHFTLFRLERQVFKEH
jgi:hypothetical protein